MCFFNICASAPCSLGRLLNQTYRQRAITLFRALKKNSARVCWRCFKLEYMLLLPSTCRSPAASVCTLPGLVDCWLFPAATWCALLVIVCSACDSSLVLFRASPCCVFVLV